MAIDRTGQAVETTRQRFMTRTVQPCLLNTAGMLVLGAALGNILYIGLSRPNETSHVIQLADQEGANSLGCYADDISLRIMPHVYTDEALTPLVRNLNLILVAGGQHQE